MLINDSRDDRKVNGSLTKGQANGSGDLKERPISSNVPGKHAAGGPQEIAPPPPSQYNQIEVKDE